MNKISVFLASLIVVIILCYATAAWAANPPMIKSVGCKTIWVYWTDPPAPPNISQAAGTVFYKAEAGGLQYFETLRYYRHDPSTLTWQYFANVPLRPNTHYIVDAFLTFQDQPGIIYAGNGDSSWHSCWGIYLPAVLE